MRTGRPANARKELTIKERKLINRAVELGNKTQAALETYNTTSRRNAGAIAQAAMRRPIVRQAYEELLNRAGLKDVVVANQWSDALKEGKGVKATHKDWLQALTTVTKMKGWLSDKSAHLRVNLSSRIKNTPVEKLSSELEGLSSLASDI